MPKQSQITALTLKVCGFSLALVFASSSAFADCPSKDIPYSAEDIAFSERVNPMLATAFKANLPGWILVYNPDYSEAKSFSYCEFEKRPKVIPAIPLAAKAEYDYFPAKNGYDVFIVANNLWENTFPYNYKNPNNQYRTQTIGTINPAVKGRITGFTIVYETTKDNPTAFSDSDIAELDQMIDKERLQQLMDGPVPDAASAKAQFDAHVAQIKSQPAIRRGQKATKDGGIAKTPPAPTKPKKPKLRLPGGLPRIPGI